jgi:hypothetical protein
MGLDIPATLETAVDAAVIHHLRHELGSRGLLLTSADLELAESTNVARGRWLLKHLLAECYPDADGLAVQFERTDDMARIGSALAFGAATSRVLAGAGDGPARRTLVEYVCAIFNLAIGLVDGICDDDGDGDVGAQLLDHCHGADLVGAAMGWRDRGWLLTRLPYAVVADDAAAFTATVIEAFFDNLHALYVDEPLVRRMVGQQLAEALRAETDSVRSPFTALSGDARLECSRATSVLPFEIISTITNAHREPASSTATVLGEAMWRVDDLVDLTDDARSGALNGVLLAAAERRGQPARYDLADLTAVLGSPGIAAAAADAGRRLHDGLQAVGVNGEDQRAYLAFVQRYADIDPAL